MSRNRADIKIKQIYIKLRKRYMIRNIIRNYRKGNLKYILDARIDDLDSLKLSNESMYCEIQDKVYKLNQERIKGKNKVKVAFVLYSAAMWSCRDLYYMMKKDERFEPYVVVAKYTNDSNTKTWPNFNASREFFEKENYDYITVPDGLKRNGGWKAMGCPDIVFYLTPYHTLLPEDINQGYLPNKVLTVYIPYSYMLIKAEKKYDSPAFKYSWRHLCDSEYYRRALIQYNPLYRRNTFFVGYPKMDIFFESKALARDLWKIQNERQKRIIYAPHHSLRDLTYCASHFSTFDKNYKLFLHLAQKYTNETTWIYKPHPNLKKTVIMAGVFETEAEYEDYVNTWDSLPNAKVISEGTYADYFLSSDAMICDSVSFLAEYQFTGKPLLLLTRPEQEFNEFGEAIQSVLYKCPGSDADGIERFITNVVIEENDTILKESI